jgi:hypothetical protein
MNLILMEMKTFKQTIIIISIYALSVLVGQKITSADLSTLVSLRGNWNFNLGDDMKWADPGYNDKDWEVIYVGKSWEQQGYVGYDGYAWYRLKISIPKVDGNRTIFFQAGNIDDVDAVYFNGLLIGSTGNFPPQFAMGYGWKRSYIIPQKFINFYGDNLIAVRVYDDGGEGGIVGSNVGIYLDDNEKYLDINLAGQWKFSIVDCSGWKLADYDDSQWENILAPMYWESQGHFNYDGYGYYRKSFVLPGEYSQQNLFLSLGKIDDYDKVYFNGECIGEVSPSRNKSEFSIRHAEYFTKRVYGIPKNLIKDGENTIAVKVFDREQGGGIYEGPIGIMNEKNLQLYKSSSYEDEFDSFDNFQIGDLFRDIFHNIFD